MHRFISKIIPILFEKHCKNISIMQYTILVNLTYYFRKIEHYRRSVTTKTYLFTVGARDLPDECLNSTEERKRSFGAF